MKKIKIYLIIDVFIACIISLNISGCGSQAINSTPKIYYKPAETKTNEEKEIKNIKIGDKAPQLTLNDIEGRIVSLNDLRSQKVIINMWWLQCHGCVDEMPYLQEFYQKHKGEVTLLAINVYDSNKIIKAFANANALTFTLLVDPDKKLDRAYVIAGVPTTFFVDQYGVIRAIKDGGFESISEIEELYDSY